MNLAKTIGYEYLERALAHNARLTAAGCKPRDPYHVARMIRRRERQLGRTANAPPPGARRIYQQKAYRASHWKAA